MGAPVLNSHSQEIEPIWAVGFMTGTSVDAVDAAMILTDGERIVDFGPAVEVPYSEADRQVIMAAVQAARDWNWSGPQPAEAFRAAEAVAVKRHGEALELILSDQSGPVPVIAGVHGQTVLHRRPSTCAPGATLQIINAPAMRERLGLPLVYDLRSADVAAGGEGAPLAPVYHRALLRRTGLNRAAVLNLGGVANLTTIDRTGELLAFDCGPANGPIDEWVVAHGKGTHDAGGALAGSGQANEGRLLDLLDLPFFDEPPPKSLDRYDFDANLVRGLSLEDGAATLTELCARAVARGLECVDANISELIVCGGGRLNPVLVDAIRKAVSATVRSAEEVGWRGDAIEAEAFAFLAVRARQGLPNSYPNTTGVPEPLTGGRLMD